MAAMEGKDDEKPRKLSGRAFYESIGSPTFVLAPMVDQSEFAWRMLTRSFMPPEASSSLLAYTPMLHARLFKETQRYRDNHFEPLKSSLSSQLSENERREVKSKDLHLDGNPSIDRPLFVQFCANSPTEILEAAKYVQPFCDAVDLNLGCPQGIARKGHYGAFLQEDWDLIFRLINGLHNELRIPVTAKMRILETKEKTLEYAKMILSAGASIITVHGRQRHQKGHNTGIADWSVIRYLRDHLPRETVIFANGNILQNGDIDECLAATGADAVMSAEGNLYDPSIFAKPPAVGDEGREYWRGRDGKGGYRLDAVLRRYLDIVYKYCLCQEPPSRKPLFVPADVVSDEETISVQEEDVSVGQDSEPPRKKQKKGNHDKVTSPNLTVMQAHLFHLLRALVSKHHDVRDSLAKCRAGNMAAFENVLRLIENKTRVALLEYERTQEAEPVSNTDADNSTRSTSAIARCKRPWWVCQPHIRPLPEEAIQKGALTISKREKAKVAGSDSLAADSLASESSMSSKPSKGPESCESAPPREALVCG